jgi:hypothetical protein
VNETTRAPVLENLADADSRLQLQTFLAHLQAGRKQQANEVLRQVLSSTTPAKAGAYALLCCVAVGLVLEVGQAPVFKVTTVKEMPSSTQISNSGGKKGKRAARDTTAAH